MSSIITLSGLSYRTPDGRALFENLDLAFGRERTGLVGRNGAGKTTLLNLIQGVLPPADGTVSVRGRVGVLRQVTAPEPGATVADLLGVSADLARLDRIERGEGDADDLAEADWLLPARLEAALADVGLAGLDAGRAAASLSGGEATRAALAGLLAYEPDMLLLDEPTNNLDREARRIVSQVLADWRGGAVVISHDRELLRQMDRIVELSGLGVRVYGGDYDLYVQRKAEERAAAQRELDDADQAVAQAAREAQRAREKKARRDASGRRFAARGSEPKILLGRQAERAELSGARDGRLAERRRADAAEARAVAEAKVERAASLAFGLPPTGLPAGRTVLAFEDVSFGYGAGPDLVAGLSFRLTGPERVALVGPNGAGKTTVLKLAAGELAPRRGQVVRAGGVAMLDQHAAVLTAEDSLLDNFRRLHPAASDNAARAALAKFLFRADAGLRRVGDLSGGERLRAALACVLGGASPPQLLILDEPTNHLDLDSIQAIENALRGYDGALLTVSHDADFLEAVGVERRIPVGPVTPACSG